MRRLAALVIGVLFLASGTALAQGRAEVSVGWRHLYIAGSDGEDGANVPKGWYADIAVPFNGRLSAVAEADGDRVVVQLVVGSLLLLAEVTRDAIARLGITVGARVYALIKSVSIEL